MEMISTNSLRVKVGVFCVWDLGELWNHAVERTVVQGLVLFIYKGGNLHSFLDNSNDCSTFLS